MKRYFIIFYSALHEDGRIMTGHSTCVSLDKYVNHNKYSKKICELGEYTTVALTNVLELSESDFNDWVEK